MEVKLVAFPLPIPEIPTLPLPPPRYSGEPVNIHESTTGAPKPPEITNLVAIAHGLGFLGIRSDLTVVTWGSSLPVPSGLSNVVAIASGGTHAVALKRDGALVAWGQDSSVEANVPAGLTNAVSISAGVRHNLALRPNGTVTAWGDNAFRQTNVPPNLSNVVAVACGGYHSMALKSDGSVVLWGNYEHGLTNPPVGLTNIVAIAAGLYHSLALRDDGTVIAWGLDDNFQTRVPTNLANVVAIAGNEYSSFAIRADGTLVGWGEIEYEVNDVFHTEGKMPELNRVLTTDGELLLIAPGNRPAMARADVRSQIWSIRLLDHGSGYSEAPAVEFIGAGSGASAVTEITNGVVSRLILTSPGSQYTRDTIIRIAPPPAVKQPKGRAVITLHWPNRGNGQPESSSDLAEWKEDEPQWPGGMDVLSREVFTDEATLFFRIPAGP